MTQRGPARLERDQFERDALVDQARRVVNGVGYEGIVEVDDLTDDTGISEGGDEDPVWIRAWVRIS